MDTYLNRQSRTLHELRDRAAVDDDVLILHALTRVAQSASRVLLPNW